jgi:TrpR-related protein YerC/YecD
MMMTTDNRDDWYTDELLDLCTALVTLDDPDEAASFLRDLCTHKELTDLTGRWAIVRHLEAGYPYREIAGRCGTSTATVTRVNQWLQHGTGGYRTVLARLDTT